MKHIYLIINPAKPQAEILEKLASALQENLYAVQIWDNFTSEEHAKNIIPLVTQLCQARNVPVLINNRWQYVELYQLSGVHFDTIPADWEQIKKNLPNNIILGITANNDLKVIEWAEQQKFSYISFCSMFPSVTANSCELVRAETILQARTITTMPLFVAGGITLDTLPQLQPIHQYFNGIALVSGVMNAENPQKALQQYQQQLQNW
ncbi:MAG: thiamine phosphate synthase [Raineya sp.]|nr:thiamine phosphate synthase [Raineya sp.]